MNLEPIEKGKSDSLEMGESNSPLSLENSADTSTVSESAGYTKTINEVKAILSFIEGTNSIDPLAVSEALNKDQAAEDSSSIQGSPQNSRLGTSTSLLRRAEAILWGGFHKKNTVWGSRENRSKPEKDDKESFGEISECSSTAESLKNAESLGLRENKHGISDSNSTAAPIPLSQDQVSNERQENCASLCGFCRCFEWLVGRVD